MLQAMEEDNAQLRTRNSELEQKVTQLALSSLADSKQLLQLEKEKSEANQVVFDLREANGNLERKVAELESKLGELTLLASHALTLAL